MRKNIALILSLGLTASLLAGCGEQTGAASVSGSSAAAAATSAASSAAAAATSAASSAAEASSQSATEASAAASTQDQTPVTITYYTWAQSNDGSYPQNMIDAFEKQYPWITVDFQMGPTDQEEYTQAQKVKLLAGDGIDVTTLFPSTYDDYIKAGYLQDITGADYLGAYTESAMDAVTRDGKVYGIPYAEDVAGVVYNKTLFEKNGWTVPTNREEWTALCGKIAAAGVTPMIQGIKDTWPLAHEVMIFMQDMYAQDPEIFDKIDKGEVKYTDDEVVNTLKEIENYFRSDAVSQDALGLTYDQAAAYFASGKAAMIAHGEWVMGSIEAAEPDFDIGVFSLPTNKEGEEHVGAAEIGQYQAIVSSSKYQDADKLFLAYMSGAEGAQYFADSMSNFTPVQGVTLKANADWTKLLSEKTLPFYYDKMYTGTSNELCKQLQLLYTGDTTAEDVAKALQAAQDKKN
jgi:raffinose/stachyose/melibiose transport system substrate-binding protein